MSNTKLKRLQAAICRLFFYSIAVEYTIFFMKADRL